MEKLWNAPDPRLTLPSVHPEAAVKNGLLSAAIVHPTGAVAGRLMSWTRRVPQVEFVLQLNSFTLTHIFPPAEVMLMDAERPEHAGPLSSLYPRKPHAGLV